ncbi:MAG: hypothetical protein IJN56_05395 [Clostridia bacterium]|nr:hypothetical protein [Clostridia bacterium]
MRKFIFFIIFGLLLALPVSADDNYVTQYNNVGADELYNGLDQQTQEFFNQYEIDPENPDWVNKFTEKNVFSHIWNILTVEIKAPLKTGILIASVIFLTAALTAFGISNSFDAAIYTATLVIGVLIASDIWQSVESAVNAIKSCSTFMFSFVPIFASILALSGKTVTAPAMSALLLGASETVAFISSFAVLPLMGGYLALSIASGVSPLLKNSGIADGVKKLSVWIMSLFGTIFVGILSVQTAINSAADSVTLRTAKFILGTSVPVAGGVLSEAVSTISSSLGLLRSSIGIYGVVALAVMLLPTITEIILWRFTLMINISLSELFSLSKISGILRAIDSMLAVILGVIMVVGGVFIISLSIVTKAGGV